MSEEGVSVWDGTHEFTAAVQNKHFSIVSENKQKPGECCNNALIYVLFYMDALVELTITLEVTPKFNTSFLNCEEVKLVIQEHWSRSRWTKSGLLCVSIFLRVSVIVFFLNVVRQKADADTICIQL